jgi:hypothetical protein
MSESEKRLLESVSALVDGEASEIELASYFKAARRRPCKSRSIRLPVSGQGIIQSPKQWLIRRLGVWIFRSLSPLQLLKSPPMHRHSRRQ